ncbi:MAG TPA: hypothetical protein VGH42_04885, partial [Verrucomicrobiae bacterium]
LMNATDTVYEIMSKTDLTLTNWSIEGELWPTNGQTNVMPFTVAANSPTNLFVWAMDWTGVTNNGNQTPSWWFWKYYQTLDLSDTNLDSSGDNTLLEAYEEGLDPNVIGFSLQFTNNYVNSSLAYGSVTIQGGVPSYIAVLINDTNTADSDWQPYDSTNVLVNLNSGDGLYNVLVGLRGLPSDATPTWLGTQLTLNTVAPVLAVTNPTSGTVSVPMIQLQGYVNESLGKLTFDVSNAVGVVTNQTGYWQPVFYDTNLLEFTTNTFQCYDIPLTNGVNEITLHATDMAGNTTITNFSCTLSYAGVTNAPTLSLLWPPNNTPVGGSNVTIQAQVSDATATVAATVNGSTVQGLIERSGLVWLQNVPLNSGTNTVIITAQNAAGKVSTNTLNVVESSVSLSIDPISSGQLNKTNVTVTGSVSDPAADVWVNGMEVDWDDDYDWYVDNVPVSATGTMVITAEAGADTNDIEALQTLDQAQPPVISLMSYTKHYQDDDTFYGYCGDGPAPFQSGEVVNWLYQSGGEDSSAGSGINAGVCAPESYSETAGLAGGYNGYAPAWENAEDTESLNWNDGSYASVGYALDDTQTHVMILPSGQQAIGQTVLYMVEAQVTNEDTGLQLAASAVQFVNQLAGTATEDVTNDDGSVWTEAVVSGAAGAQTEATPMAAGNYSFIQMKLSKLVYFSVAPDNVPSSFQNNISSVQSKLHSELASQVFYNLTTDTDVQIKVAIENTPHGKLGWDSGAKQTYVNRVNFGWNNLACNTCVAERDLKGGIAINLNWFANNLTSGTQYVTAQGWVNILAHEGMGNVAVKNDCVYIPLIHDCTDYEIFSGTQSYDDSNPFTVSSDSRLAILKGCGLKSN